MRVSRPSRARFLACHCRKAVLRESDQPSRCAPAEGSAVGVEADQYGALLGPDERDCFRPAPPRSPLVLVATAPVSDASAFRAASAVWGAAPPALVFDSSLPGPIHERDCTTPPGSVPPRSVRCALVDSPSSRPTPACWARQRTTTVRERPGACRSNGIVTLASSAPSTRVSGQQDARKGSDGSAATQVAASTPAGIGSIDRSHRRTRAVDPL